MRGGGRAGLVSEVVAMAGFMIIFEPFDDRAAAVSDPVLHLWCGTVPSGAAFVPHPTRVYCPLTLRVHSLAHGARVGCLPWQLLGRIAGH